MWLFDRYTASRGRSVLPLTCVACRQPSSQVRVHSSQARRWELRCRPIRDGHIKSIAAAAHLVPDPPVPLLVRILPVQLRRLDGQRLVQACSTQGGSGMSEGRQVTQAAFAVLFNPTWSGRLAACAGALCWQRSAGQATEGCKLGCEGLHPDQTPQKPLQIASSSDAG